MAEGFEVVDAELREFAKSLASTGEKLKASASAVRGVSYSAQTFGIVLSSLIIREVCRRSTNGAADALDGASGQLDNASTGLDNTAQVYQDVDGYARDNFKGILK